ncbi:MAG TPA: tyrosine-type recombinase/integrase [Candidatus Sulfotelmatobacter sp.]|nr:tyrosine-type recombinase/integrase [Candidatus Sulfotelmatobacter sp.]
MTLHNSLSTWAALRAGVVKPRTQKYHQEVIAYIGRTWPEKFSEDVDRIPQAECKRSLRTACELAGLHRLTHHDFRHLFTTRCIESGVDIPTVARWRGDKDGGAMFSFCSTPRSHTA